MAVSRSSALQTGFSRSTSFPMKDDPRSFCLPRAEGTGVHPDSLRGNERYSKPSYSAE